MKAALIIVGLIFGVIEYYYILRYWRKDKTFEVVMYGTVAVAALVGSTFV